MSNNETLYNVHYNWFDYDRHVPYTAEQAIALIKSWGHKNPARLLKPGATGFINGNDRRAMVWVTPYKALDYTIIPSSGVITLPARTRGGKAKRERKMNETAAARRQRMIDFVRQKLGVL